MSPYYLVVKCPRCKKLSIYMYDPYRKSKTRIKVCPYCGYRFYVFLKNKPTWERIMKAFDDIREAMEFIKRNQRD